MKNRYLKLFIIYILLLLCGCTPGDVAPIKIQGSGNSLEEIIEDYEIQKDLRFYEYSCPYEPKDFRGKFFLPDYNNINYVPHKNYTFILQTKMYDKVSYTDRITGKEVIDYYLITFLHARFSLDTSDISSVDNYIDINVTASYYNAYSEYKVNLDDIEHKRTIQLRKNLNFYDMYTLSYGYLQLNEKSEDKFEYLYINDEYFIINDKNEKIVINNDVITINYTKGIMYKDFLYLYSDDYSINPDLIGLKEKLDNLYSEGFNEFNEKEMFFEK